MKLTLLCLFISFFLICCSKKDNNDPAKPTREKTYITEITSIQTTNFTVDTTRDSLPPIKGSISTPASEATFKNIFREAFDNLSLSFNRIDSLPFDLQFKKALLIPYLVLGQGAHSLVFAPDDSIRVDAYKTSQTFGFNRDHSTYSYEFSGPIDYTLKRFYKRIHFTADIQLNVKDNEGGFITLTGTLKGSKVGNTWTEMDASY